MLPFPATTLTSRTQSYDGTKTVTWHQLWAETVTKRVQTMHERKQQIQSILHFLFCQRLQAINAIKFEECKAALTWMITNEFALHLQNLDKVYSLHIDNITNHYAFFSQLLTILLNNKRNRDAKRMQGNIMFANSLNCNINGTVTNLVNDTALQAQISSIVSKNWNETKSKSNLNLASDNINAWMAQMASVETKQKHSNNEIATVNNLNDINSKIVAHRVDPKNLQSILANFKVGELP